LSFAPQAGQLTSIAIRALQIDKAPEAPPAFTVWVIAAVTGNRKSHARGNDSIELRQTHSRECTAMPPQSRNTLK
jgi:hypothetical protein